MSIKGELLNLQHAHPDNVLHAADVVEWAQAHPESALYAAIEWNDKKAADEFRLSQVRKLIQLHVISDEGAPLVVSLSIDRKAAGGYRAISDVVEHADLREVMLADALAELERVQQKYARVKELEAVWVAAEEVKTRMPVRSRRGRQAVNA